MKTFLQLNESLIEDEAQVSALPARRKGYDVPLSFSSPKDITQTKYTNCSDTQTPSEIIICEIHHLHAYTQKYIRDFSWKVSVKVKYFSMWVLVF